VLLDLNEKLASDKVRVTIVVKRPHYLIVPGPRPLPPSYPVSELAYLENVHLLLRRFLGVKLTHIKAQGHAFIFRASTEAHLSVLQN